MRYCSGERLILLGIFLCVCRESLSEKSAGVGSCSSNENFEEDLLVRPLPDGNVMTHLHLTTKGSARLGQHYGMFPKVIGEMVDTYGVGEIHVTFSRGQWIGQRWGSAPVPSPQGVELLAWFTPAGDGVQHRSASELQVAWRGLTNALAGLLGAPLNFLAPDTKHVHPKHSVRPRSGVLRALFRSDTATAPESHVFMGALPREIACTENLTPWGKLLPCRQRAGLASLLRAERACRGLFSSYSMHVTLECKGGMPKSGKCSKEALQLILVQTATVVQSSQEWHTRSPERMSRGSLARFVLSSLLPDPSTQGLTSCPLASASWVHVHMGHDWHEKTTFHVNISRPAAHVVLGEERRELRGSQGVLFSWQLGSESVSALDVTIRWAVFQPAALTAGRGASLVTARRVLASRRSAFTRADGILVLEVVNNHPSSSVSVLVLDTLPWFARIFTHTLRAHSSKHAGLSEYRRRAQSLLDLQDAEITLARLRAGMTQLEYRLDIPANGSVRVEVEMRRAFLELDEFPPDANRGFDMPAPRVTYTATTAAAAGKRGGGAAERERIGSSAQLEECTSIQAGAMRLGKDACVDDGLLYRCVETDPGFARKLGTPAACLEEAVSEACVGGGERRRLCVQALAPAGGPSVVLFPANVALEWPGLVRPGVVQLGEASAWEGGGGPVVEYGDSVLLQCPMPDFSMPYNVITLTCTVLALFFGSIFNLITRTLRPLATPKKDSGSKEGLAFGSVLGLVSVVILCALLVVVFEAPRCFLDEDPAKCVLQLFSALVKG